MFPVQTPKGRSESPLLRMSPAFSSMVANKRGGRRLRIDLTKGEEHLNQTEHAQITDGFLCFLSFLTSEIWFWFGWRFITPLTLTLISVMLPSLLLRADSSSSPPPFSFFPFQGLLGLYWSVHFCWYEFIPDRTADSALLRRPDLMMSIKNATGPPTPPALCGLFVLLFMNTSALPFSCWPSLHLLFQNVLCSFFASVVPPAPPLGDSRCFQQGSPDSQLVSCDSNLKSPDSNLVVRNSDLVATQIF